MVMSEFLTRGWNVATPEVDIGDDIFVVQDDNGTLRRVQVKTATSTHRKNSYSGQFNVPIKQLRNTSNVLVHYVFIVRHANSWSKPVVICQDYLLDHWENDNIGSQHKDNLNLHFTYTDKEVKCSKTNLSKYISDFTDFPIIEE